MSHRLPRRASALAVLLVALSAALAALEDSSPRVVRLPGNPIIRPEMLNGDLGSNINGPSLIRVPAWVGAPLGRYYLYFAHHGGSYIRLAYADRLEGPWRIHQEGVLRIGQAAACAHHIASPDVVVTGREIRMYFHCPVGDADAPQKSFLARSSDGLHFEAAREPLGDAYFRVFFRDGAWYALAWGGRLFRSADGVSAFEAGANPFAGNESRAALSDSSGPRHVAIEDAGATVWVYYSNIGDKPERILRGRLETRGDWGNWRISGKQEIARPETAYEGADLPIRRSHVGHADGREHGLRDPFIFQDAGKTYLLYSVAAESGIAITELQPGRK